MRIHLESGTYKSIEALDWTDIPMLAVVTGPNGAGKSHLLECCAAALGAYELLPRPAWQLPVLRVYGLTNKPTAALQRSEWPDQILAGTSGELNQFVQLIWNDRRSVSTSWNNVWLKIEEAQGKNRNEISEEEFLESLPVNFPLLGDSGFPVSNIGAFFLSYALTAEQLGLSSKQPEDVEGKLGPPPWSILENALAAAGLAYSVIAPVLPKRSRFGETNYGFVVQLVHKQTGRQTSISELSSGEKALFRVACWVFCLDQQKLATASPKILLLDEPDAHLHPVLTKNFFRLLSHLIEHFGIRVIMTTHSPSTVALAPRGSLFSMSYAEPRIRGVASKWDALRELTAGYHSIGSEQKCIYVEGSEDAEYFKCVYEVLADMSSGSSPLATERPLCFVPVVQQKTSGGWSQVVAIVEQIQTSNVAGIVDGDNRALNKDRIYQLSRRNLESYLLDPLVVFATLYYAGAAPSVEGITIGRRQISDFLSLPNEVLQKAVDSVADVMRVLMGEEGLARDKVQVVYLGDREVELEQWWFEVSIEHLFQPLHKKFKVSLDPNKLRDTISRAAIVPMDIVQIVQKVQLA